MFVEILHALVLTATVMSCLLGCIAGVSREYRSMAACFSVFFVCGWAAYLFEHEYSWVVNLWLLGGLAFATYSMGLIDSRATRRRWEIHQAIRRNRRDMSDFCCLQHWEDPTGIFSDDVRM